MADINENILSIWLPAWGPTHLGLAKNFALPSLMQPGNLPLCGFERIHVDCVTLPEYADALERIVQEGLAPLTVQTNVIVHPDHNQVSIVGLRQAVINARRNKTRLLAVLPDTVFGNGSIANLVHYARGKPVCVAAGHLRVKDADFAGHFGGRFTGASNSDLVSLAFKFAHQCTEHSFSAFYNGTFHGGISLTSLGAGLYSMVHHLPSIFLAWFTEADERYFNECPVMGFWDHRWPSTLLAESRYRVIGSSDLFFAVELTHPNLNRIEVAPDSEFQESYRSGEPHCRLNEHFVIALRSNG